MDAPILIVDDSLTVRMDLVHAFEAAGVRTIACSSAQAARDAVAHQTVALMILDVLLPDADGLELLSELRAAPNARGAPALMLSTEAEVSARIRGLQTGAEEYVGKPYDTSYVVARAQELLRPLRGHDDPKIRVLVVDDSTTFREMLKAALEHAGYETLSAASGEEGLHIAATSRPHAVIVDGVLPGVDGATVIRRIRLDPALRSTPCLLLTASQEDAAELQALDAGADAFVRKEDDIDVALARLAAAIRRSAGRPDPAAIASALGPKKILAIDDSMTYLQNLGDALRGEGYDVALARSGEEALDLLAVQPVDCILLDLLMPGLGGEETCRRIKAVSTIRDIPLVILTAVESRDAMIASLVAGADDYISKSSELEVLKARVRAQIRRRQFEDENRRIREELLERRLEANKTRAARELAETRAVLVEELENKNRELEAFGYSVSHDLRAPLRSIDGFSKILLDDYAVQLDSEAQHYLRRVRTSAQRMGELIDDLLELSRLGRGELRRDAVDLSALVHVVLEELQKAEPERRVTAVIMDGLRVDGDARLLRIALENLFGNAWKFSAKRAMASIEFGTTGHEPTTYYVKDNGAGFDASYIGKLFRPFQRLHSAAEFSGTGIGLATVARIINRHGGRIWAESKPGLGATFYFTLRTH